MLFCVLSLASSHVWLQRQEFRNSLVTIGLLRFLSGRLGFVFRLALESNLGGHAKAFVVGELDDLPHLHVAKAKVQGIVGAYVGREPVLAINLLAVGHKLG